MRISILGVGSSGPLYPCILSPLYTKWSLKIACVKSGFEISPVIERWLDHLGSFLNIGWIHKWVSNFVVLLEGDGHFQRWGYPTDISGPWLCLWRSCLVPTLARLSLFLGYREVGCCAPPCPSSRCWALTLDLKQWNQAKMNQDLATLSQSQSPL